MGTGWLTADEFEAEEIGEDELNPEEVGDIRLEPLPDALREVLPETLPVALEYPL